jgi:hypothetical protein
LLGVGFDRVARPGLAGSGALFPVRRTQQASRDLPNLEYRDPHIPVHTLVKYTNDAVRRLVKGQQYGASWEGQQFILRDTLTLVPTDWYTVCQVAVTVQSAVSIRAEVSWRGDNNTDVNWRFLRDNKILHLSAGHHLANDKKTVTPISELYFANEPPGPHTYVLQLSTNDEEVEVYAPTRLSVIA